MDSSPETITFAVRALADRAGLNMSQFAKRLGYKTTSGVQRYFDADLYKGGYLNPELVAKMVDRLVGLGEPPIVIDDIRPLAGPVFSEPADDSRRTQGFTPVITPGAELVSQERALPLYAAARGGAGNVIVTFEPIEHLKMPTILQGVRGGYGLLITGDSMIPAYWPGDMALVNPNLPPQRDTDVILYHTLPSAAGEAEAIIKRLVGMNDREWTLEQYRPAETFKEARPEWPVCHRVVGKYNSR